MKKISTLLLASMLCLVGWAQYEVVPLMQNGPDNNRVNYIFLGDGYLSSQQDQFVSDAQAIVTDLFNTTPYKELKNFYNVYAIKVPSNVQGAAMNSGALIDNKFGSSYWAWNIERLLYPYRQNVIQQVLDNNFPSRDYVFMVVNHTKYGGSGGEVATASINPTAGVNIALHEIGHSQALLIDEYWAGNQYAREGANMTQNTNSSTVRWSPWYGEYGVGIYPHAESPSWYRPHQNCMMRYLGNPFCVVCSDEMAYVTHTLINMIDDYSPISTSPTVTGSQTFSLELIEAIPAASNTQWTLNNTVQNGNTTPSITLDGSDLNVGSNTLKARVTNPVSFIRRADHLSVNSYSIQWNINYVSNVGIADITSKRQSLAVKAYPNPVRDILTFDVEGEGNQRVNLKISDLSGKVVADVWNGTTNDTQQKIEFDMSGLSAGSYLILVSDESQLIESLPLIKQ